MKEKKTTVFGLVILILIIAIFVRSKPNIKEESIDIYDALDTVSKITVISEGDTEEILKECSNIIHEYDNRLSMYKEGSEIYRINNSDQMCEVGDEVFEIIKKCGELYNDTNGKFDITVGAVSNIWKDAFESGVLPEKEYIDNVNKFTGYDSLIFGENSIKRGNDVQKITLGAVAKGHITDKLKEYLDNENIKGALCYLGGNIYAAGKRKDGELWNVGIADPDDTENVLGTLKVSDKFIITSGDYERYLEKDKKRYHHIIDAKNGFPVNEGIRSVTIISDNGFLGDALSTACFLSGLDGGIKLSNKYGVYAIFVIDDKKVYYSAGLENCFSKINTKYEYIKFDID